MPKHKFKPSLTVTIYDESKYFGLYHGIMV